MLEPGRGPVDAGERLAATRPHHRDPRARGRELPLDLGRRARGVEGHDRGTRPQRRQVRHHVEPVVGGQERHPVVGLHPQADEPGPQLARLAAELAVGGRVAPVEEGDGVVGVRVDDRGQVHATSAAHSRHRTPLRPRSAISKAVGISCRYGE